ncbi:sialate O-acetylesterase [Pontibacter actiniarum]|uniref:sialate O-acetylesterase n=1 Tax=Pontibacter actiniarum TaxID=323450 RepID=UPI0013C4EF76|nr:sialate O-acetylesterase [Pontibacter actiniarum]
MRQLNYLLLICFGGALFLSCSQHAPAPQNEVAVHVILGQSNSIGRAYASQLPRELRAPLDSCYIYNVSRKRFEVIEAGVNTQSQAGQFGPVVKAAQLLRDHQQREVYFVVAGYGNTQLYSSGSEPDWNADSHELTQEVLRVLEQSQQALKAEGKTAVFKSVTWWQGENDAKSSEKAAAYGQNEAAFFTFLDQTPYLHSAKRVVYKLFPEPSVMPYADKVNAAKAKRASSDAKTLSLIDTRKYELNPQDKLHATAKGQVQAGTDLFKAIKNL